PTESGIALGTASYMSPEQARGARVDHRSDVFSFGIVLYEMLIGRPPFRGKSRVDTLHGILYDPAPPLPPSIGTATDDLQRIIEKCLAKEPEDRYQGMRDLVVDLRAARRRLDSSPMRAADAAAERPLNIGRGLWMAGAAAIAVLMIAVLGMWLFARRVRGENERRAAVAEVAHLVYR